MEVETEDAQHAVRRRGCGGVRRCRVLEIMDGEAVEWRLTSDDGQEPMLLRRLVWMAQPETPAPAAAVS